MNNDVKQLFFDDKTTNHFLMQGFTIMFLGYYFS